MADGAAHYVRGIAPDAENRERDDFYPTPPVAVHALLGVETFEGSIWEPACGNGAISTILEAAGHHVISTDLIERGYGISGVDFLLDYRTVAENIVTNPPFKLAAQFAEHAIARSTGKVALLCRLAWLEGKARRKLFESTPLARVWVFSERIPLWRHGVPIPGAAGGMIAFCWLVWQHGHQGRPTLGWL